MSLSDRKGILTTVLTCLALAGCGYAPAYAPGGQGETLRNRVEIADPFDVTGFDLVRALEARLGEAELAIYRLDAEIQIGEQGVGILRDQTTTRFQLAGIVDYTLSDLATGDALAMGRVSNFTSYSATSTTVATTAARRDARERLMITLADQIVAELLLTESEWAR